MTSVRMRYELNKDMNFVHLINFLVSYKIMTLEQRLTALITQIGADIKTLTTNDGSLAALATIAKGSLVAAINELHAEIAGLGGGAEIDDNAAANSTTKTYSVNKIAQLVATAKSEILGGADAAHDTLIELQSLLNNQDSAVSNLLTAIGNRVRFDAAQTLSAGEKTQARANISAADAALFGNTDRDLTADYAAAKA